MAAERRSKRIPRGLLFVASLAVGVFVALQAHELWIAPRAGETPGSPTTEQTQPASPRLDVGELLAEPLSTTGLRRLKSEPGGIAAPPNAAGREALQRGGGDGVEEFARYYVPAETFQPVVEHYRRAAAEVGFSPIGERSEQDERVLVFHRSGARAVLRLRRDKRKEMIAVTLSVTLPSNEHGALGEEH
ncbi:MAG: hypothetical protein ACOC9S_00080 [Planctomycetota bacterium]